VDNDIEIVEGAIEEGQQVAVTQLSKLDTGVRVRVGRDSNADKRGP
jgi:hypothetical protein